MKATFLGHAGWLVEAAGLRILMDPLVGCRHHGDVFDVSPRRELVAAQLRPDFILVSHRHPDHFDVPSLGALAGLDRESVVVTPDPLVQWAANEVGFSTVHLTAPGHRVDLDGLSFVTTTSVSSDEWGVMFATEDGGVFWNQVDTVFRDTSHAATVSKEALAALGRDRVDLLAVQWQPMLEIAVQLGDATGFPYEAYAEVLDRLRAIGPGCIVPAASGTAHAAPATWMNRFVHPVARERFLEDAAITCPHANVLAPDPGSQLVLDGGKVTLSTPQEPSLVRHLDAGPPRHFHPLDIPPITDAAGPHDQVARQEVAVWITETLAPALRRAAPDFELDRPARFVVEAHFPGTVDAWTVIVDAERAVVEAGSDPAWDAINAISGTWLHRVLRGERHWGDLLLSGSIRARTRAYRVDDEGLHPANIAPTFLYYALSYDASVERAVRHAVAEWTSKTPHGA